MVGVSNALTNSSLVVCDLVARTTHMPPSSDSNPRPACHAEGRGLESHHPLLEKAPLERGFFVPGNRSREGWGTLPATADYFSEQRRAERSRRISAISEESRRGVPRTVQTDSRPTLPDNAKGGELVLKLFAFTQAFAASTADVLRRREEGQTMAEYGVILAVVTLAVVASLTLLGGNLRAAFENIAGILPG
jgi:Flp pilus assembly pilin Flp